MVGDYTYYVEAATGLVHECPDPAAAARQPALHPLFTAILAPWAPSVGCCEFCGETGVRVASSEEGTSYYVVAATGAPHECRTEGFAA